MTTVTAATIIRQQMLMTVFFLIRFEFLTAKVLHLKR